MIVPNRVLSTHSQTLSRTTSGPDAPTPTSGSGAPTPSAPPAPENPANGRFARSHKSKAHIPTRQQLMHAAGISAGTLIGATAGHLLSSYPWVTGLASSFGLGAMGVAVGAALTLLLKEEHSIVGAAGKLLAGGVIGGIAGVIAGGALGTMAPAVALGGVGAVMGFVLSFEKDPPSGTKKELWPAKKERPDSGNAGLEKGSEK